MVPPATTESESGLPRAALKARALLLTVKQAAVRLACSPSHVRGLIARGELAAVDISARSQERRELRLEEPEIERFIDARRIRTGGAAGTEETNGKEEERR